MENLVLDDERLDDMLNNAEQQQPPDVEAGSSNAEMEPEENEEDSQQLEGIKRLVIPSSLSNTALWKKKYVEKHMEPQIKLLRILAENTSLGQLMDKQRLKKIESTLLNPNQSTCYCVKVPPCHAHQVIWL